MFDPRGEAPVRYAKISSKSGTCEIPRFRGRGTVSQVLAIVSAQSTWLDFQIQSHDWAAWETSVPPLKLRRRERQVGQEADPHTND
ncbi:hypothetical protein PG985_004932 [Apiospora marii]|uniref:Uncharacterized protein n=1 Tax=Apiospora marii TaxID=335849 RepID=A0ABR1SAE9_9PEZI